MALTKVSADLAQVASQAEAEAGTNTTRLMTPQRVSQAIAALETGEANAALASQAEAEAGTENTKTMTPLRVSQAIAALETGFTGTGIAQITLATGSPTAVTIASGLSGVTRIELFLKGASHNGTNEPIMIRMGDSGGIETTGYDSDVKRGSGANSTRTDGFTLQVDADGDAATLLNARITLLHLGSNLWTCSHIGGQDVTGANSAIVGLGDKTLSGELTQLQLVTPGGTATFDAGTIQGLYW